MKIGPLFEIMIHWLNLLGGLVVMMCLHSVGSLLGRLPSGVVGSKLYNMKDFYLVSRVGGRTLIELLGGGLLHKLLCGDSLS